MIQISEQEYERLKRAAGEFVMCDSAEPLIGVAVGLAQAIDGYRALLPPTANGQTVALLEKAAERVSEAARPLRTVAAREGRRAEMEATR